MDGIIRIFKLNKEYENNDLEMELSHNIDWKRRILERYNLSNDLSKKDSVQLKEAAKSHKTKNNFMGQDESNYDQAVKKLLKMSAGIDQCKQMFIKTTKRRKKNGGNIPLRKSTTILK